MQAVADTHRKLAAVGNKLTDQSCVICVRGTVHIQVKGRLKVYR